MLQDFNMDASLFNPRFSNQPSRTGVVPQSQIEDPTSKKPRMVKTASQLEISVTRDIVTANSMYKTELCRNFMEKGKCRYGEECIFAHGSKDKRKNALEWHKSSGDGKMDRNSNVVNEITYSKGTCKFFFSKKACPYGNKCFFMHEGFEKSGKIRDITSESCVISIQTDDFTSETNPWLKTRLCNKWMMLNSCVYGAKCSYAHGRAELRSPLSTRSVSRNTWIAPRTSKKDEPLPHKNNAKEQTDVQKAPQTMCSLKWKATKKIVGVYADWIDEELPMHCSASEQVP